MKGARMWATRSLTSTLMLAMPMILVAWAGAPDGSGWKDIAKTLVKEPRYRNPPKYALLAFGAEAKTHAWLVVDGDRIYLDCQANGDLTPAGNLVAQKAGEFKPVVIADPRRETKYKIVAIEVRKEENGFYCDVEVNVNGQYQQYGGWRLADRPKDAGVLHFDGPLTWIIANKLVRGKKPVDLRVSIGTQHPTTIGDSAGGFCCVLHEVCFPAGIHPVAAIEFPSKTPGGNPIKMTVALEKRC